jgi:hypothetical protein
MPRPSTITVEFDVTNFGCLQGVLEFRLEEARRHYRIAGRKYDPLAVKMHEQFIQQLNGCISAVSAAREAYIKGVSP